ncbi:hypothetical protein WJF07_000913 [Klebsiella pneumoniae]
MNHTLSDSQLEAMIKSAVNSSGPLPPDEKFSQLVSALRELQERRKAEKDSEPVAWTWHYREQWHVTNDERHAEFVAKDGDVAVLPLYRHVQPAPVVPKSIGVREAISALESAGAVTTIGQAYKMGWNACRAAMLERQLVDRVDEELLNTIKAPTALGSLPKTGEVQNTNSPVNDVTTGKPLTNGDSVTCKSLTSINPAPALASLPKNAKSLTGNSPVIPDGSEHCPCCGKKLRRACSVEGCDGNHVAHGLCQKHYDMKRWEDPEQVERFREAGRRYRGKKKTTVATPQEPKP